MLDNFIAPDPTPSPQPLPQLEEPQQRPQDRFFNWFLFLWLIGVIFHPIFTLKLIAVVVCVFVGLGILFFIFKWARKKGEMRSKDSKKD